MNKRPMTADDLWELPRVGVPVPSPKGDALVVPVTTYSMDDNAGTTRLWHVPADAAKAGAGGPRDSARALTGAGRSATSPAWSPDGARLAFVRKPDDDGKPQLHVMPVDGGEAECLTSLPLGASEPRWFPDGKRIAFLSPVLLEAMTIAGTTKAVEARAKDPVKALVTEDRLFRFWDRWLTGGERHHVFVIDVETREITDATPKLRGWLDLMDPAGSFAVAPDGKEIAYAACRSKPPHNLATWGLFTVAVPASGRGRVRDITPSPCAEALRPTYSPDGRFILYGRTSDPESWADGVRLEMYDRKRRAHRAVGGTWDLSAAEWAFSADGRSILCFADVDGRSGLFAFNVASVAAGRSARPRELARGGTFAGLRPGGKRIYTCESSLRGPGEIVSFARDGTDRRQVTAFTAPVMKHLAIGKVQEVVFKGADDAPVQMLLVHPPNRVRATKRRVRRPLVHLIHGGPHGAFGDGWHWRWCAQVFAARGYLVALVNFHGSVGWGQAFTRSIEGTWGDKPFTDVMRATDTLIERGLVDPKRMAATGGSYGGYMASWIASQTDRFACIVNHAGVCDLQSMYGSDIMQGWPRSAGGSPWKDQEGMDRYSPIRHARGFKTPMLVIHGEQDYRVPYGQALEIYNIYKSMKRPARLVCYPDENHWILKPRNSVHWYGEFLGWLERWFRRGEMT